MFTRKLKPDEQNLLVQIENLVQATTEGPFKDPPQVLEVLKFAVAIGQKIPDPVNPMLLASAALLHEVGRGVLPGGTAGGLLGAAVVESFLRSTNLSDHERVQTLRSVTAVSAQEVCQLESPEERVLSDAIQLESCSMLGVLRDVRAARTSLADYIKSERVRRKLSFDKLYFDASREVGQPIYRQGEIFLKTVEQACYGATAKLKDVGLPV